ncbi:probable enoyl-CoA hydratase 2, mitochondrial isoform X2 [Neltuma alba]|uniref:probable enoyl-CoA hydratase 2, mitochondrial isoform X2 n=1 Tax=Neltuma alba TaxID=207710 RepID=UPI0010A588C7|nr:probable enoyl-CoA hydratase 2, mitochondrial isoform X2 [Prosopis alba]
MNLLGSILFGVIVNLLPILTRKLRPQEMYTFRALSRSIGREHSKISTSIHKLSWVSFVAASQQTDACTPNRWHPHYQSRRTLILEPLGSEYVKLQKLDGSDSGIVEVTLDRPKNKNAIDTKLMRGLKYVLELIHQDSSANVAIFTSSVPRVYCAGADLKERKTFSASEVREYSKALRATFSYLEALPIPTIAAVEGAALGGGLELALACDFRICEDALLGLPETGHAIIPGAGATRRLPRLINKAIAKDLVLTGRRVGGREAESLGLANYCVPAGEAYSKALEVARVINEKGPIAIKAGKRAIEEGLLVSDPEEAADLEEECYEMTLNTKDRLEGLAAFVEKRKPIYKGH